MTNTHFAAVAEKKLLKCRNFYSNLHHINSHSGKVLLINLPSGGAFRVVELRFAFNVFAQLIAQFITGMYIFLQVDLYL